MTTDVDNFSPLPLALFWPRFTYFWPNNLIVAGQRPEAQQSVMGKRFGWYRQFGDVEQNRRFPEGCSFCGPVVGPLWSERARIGRTQRYQTTRRCEKRCTKVLTEQGFSLLDDTSRHQLVISSSSSPGASNPAGATNKTLMLQGFLRFYGGGGCHSVAVPAQKRLPLCPFAR
jgi:hypothetical protein